MKNFEGPLEVPCTDCYITNFHAGLEFQDGSVANADTGMWLHHTLLVDFSEPDVTCDEAPARLFASGNERTVLDISNNGYVNMKSRPPPKKLVTHFARRTRNVGVYFSPNANVTHTTELMNESALSRAAFLTIDYEFVLASDKSAAAGFRAVTPVWIDIAGLCSNAEYNVTLDKPVFDAEIVWESTISGEMLSVMGHLHDGGVRQDVGVNGEVLCEHVARYGESAGFITHVGMYGDEDVEGQEGGHDHGDGSHSHDEGEAGHDHGEEGEPNHDHGEGEGEAGHDHGSDGHILHISSMSSCKNLGSIKPGDELSIKAYYNLTQHAPMAGHHGGLEPVMGITMVYVLEDESEEGEA